MGLSASKRKKIERKLKKYLLLYELYVKYRADWDRCHPQHIINIDHISRELETIKNIPNLTVILEELNTSSLSNLTVNKLSMILTVLIGQKCNEFAKLLFIIIYLKHTFKEPTRIKHKSDDKISLNLKLTGTVSSSPDLTPSSSYLISTERISRVIKSEPDDSSSFPEPMEELTYSGTTESELGTPELGPRVRTGSETTTPKGSHHNKWATEQDFSPDEKEWVSSPWEEIDMFELGSELLDLSMRGNNIEITKILLEIKYFDPSYRKNIALLKAIQNDRVDIVEILLNHPRVDLRYDFNNVFQNLLLRYFLFQDLIPTFIDRIR